jgi:hypothetical protein
MHASHPRTTTHGDSVISFHTREEINTNCPRENLDVSTLTGRCVLDANLIADALAGQVEERRCRKELSTAGPCETLGAQDFLAVLGQPSVHGNVIDRFLLFGVQF